MDIKSLNNGRINETQIKDGASVKRSQKGEKARELDALLSNPPIKSSEKVELSPETQLLSEGVNEARRAPDVRADRVAQLREQVRAGTYRVDAKAVADKMLKEHLEEAGAAQNE